MEAPTASRLLLVLVALYLLPKHVFSKSMNITSPYKTFWGEWGQMEFCPESRFVQAFQLKTQQFDPNIDNTALNGIRLFCGNPNDPETKNITSSVGIFGTWGKIFNCYPNVIHGFQLRVQDPLTEGDNTATNNVMFHCLARPASMIEGDGLDGGEFVKKQRHCWGNDKAICGIQTQVQEYKESDDNTSLNNVRLQCCDRRPNV